MAVQELGHRVTERLDALQSDDPDRVFLWDVRRDMRLEYGEAARLVAEWRGALARAGVYPGTRVILALPNGLAFSILYLAIIAHGATVVPVNPQAPAGERARVAAKSSPVLVVCDDEADWPPTNPTAPVWRMGPRGYASIPRRLRRVEPSATASGRAVDPADGAVLLFTSGTTGDSKGVRLSVPRLWHTAGHIARHHGFSREDVGFSTLPQFHINAQVVGLLATLFAGGTLALDDRFHATDFWTMAAAVNPTWINAVPAIIGILARQAGPSALLPRLHFVRSASAPLPLPDLNRFQSRFGVPIVETYGLTEAGSQVAANPVPPGRRKPGSVGLPVGVRLQVVAEDGTEARPGEPGEVRIGGPGVVDRYIIGGEGVDSFRDGWFYTGDHGYRDRDGYLFLTGRTRELINRGGQKVAPREVEDVLLQHPAVAQAAVIGLPHPLLGEEVAAYVVVNDPMAHVVVAELERLVARDLSAYKRPVAIHAIDRLPVGPTGKIQRLRLKADLLAAGAGVS
jgi:acyl-CoA synthetase (AMP-forming)/AMP-acid ligase II